MKPSQVLETNEFKKVLALAAEQEAAAVMTYESAGKWRTVNAKIATITETAIHIAVLPEERRKTSLAADQPVGISFEQEHSKYIFETVVAGLEPAVSESSTGKISLQMPERIEKMERRAYIREIVPDSLNVKVIFWHRGYTDDSPEMPPEQYWQGKLVNLSAGGVQVTIDLDQEANFRVDQLVGLQFTPLPYQKPIILEGHIKHIEQIGADRALTLGVHALGLEVNSQGRQTLHRIIDVVGEYRKLNAAQTEQPNVSATKKLKKQSSPNHCCL